MRVTFLLLEEAMARLPPSTDDNQGRIIPVEADRRLLTEVAKGVIPGLCRPNMLWFVSVSKH